MRTRVLSALVLVPVVLGILLWPGSGLLFPGWPFAALVLLMILQGLKEFYDGCRKAGYKPLDAFGHGLGILFLLMATPLASDRHQTLLRFALTALVIMSLVWEVLWLDREPLKNLPPMWMGALYVGWLFPYAVRLRVDGVLISQHLKWQLPRWMEFAGEGAWLVFFTLVVTASVDTGAYFVGKAIGRHRMAPVLSPKKTWEGSVGGFLSAVLFGAALGYLLRLPIVFSLVAGAVIGVMAQFGDLAKSAIKREIGIKDFGTLIPGHGGVLDRFDSLLFTAPTLYWLLVFWPRAE